MRLTRALFLLFLLFMDCLAQSASVEPDSRKIQEDNARTEFFLSAARRLATDSSALEPKTERALFMIRLAGVSWSNDETLARNLLLQSFDLAAATGNDETDESGRSSQALRPEVLFQEAISTAEQHDHSLAQELQRRRDTYLKTAPKKSSTRETDAGNLSRALLLSASTALKDDEQRARHLFRQSAFHYTTQDHFVFLRELRKRTSNIADQWFSDLLTTLAQRPLREANEALILASYLFSPSGSVNYSLVAGYNAANVLADLSAVPANRDITKQYLAFLIRYLQVNDTAPAAVVHIALNNMLPHFQSFSPELMDIVYARLGSIRTLIPPAEFNALEIKGDKSESDMAWTKRLKKADGIAKDELRDLEYFTIIDGYLLPQNNFSEALQIVEKVSDRDIKLKLTDYIRLRSIQYGINRLDSESSGEKISEKINTPLLKALALCEEATFLHRHQSDNEASLVLEEAIKQAERLTSHQDRIQIRIAIVNSFLEFNVARAFDLARQTFSQVGKGEAYDINRSNFILPIVVYGLRNELPLRISAGSSATTSIKNMCRVDCVEAFNVSQVIADRSSRLWAGLVAVNDVLNKPSKARRSNGQ